MSIQNNISSSSYIKALKMSDRGDYFVLDGPGNQGSELLYLVKSQMDAKKCYYVSIAPKAIMTIKNKREFYKNYQYKCTCDDFKA